MSDIKILLVNVLEIIMVIVKQQITKNKAERTEEKKFLLLLKNVPILVLAITENVHLHPISLLKISRTDVFLLVFRLLLSVCFRFTVNFVYKTNVLQFKIILWNIIRNFNTIKVLFKLVF